MLLDVVVVDDDVKPGAVLFVVGDLGEVEGPQLGKHDDHRRPVVGLVLDGVAVQGQAVEVRQLPQLADISEPLDLVPVKVEHLQGLENSLGNFLFYKKLNRAFAATKYYIKHEKF